MSKSPPPAKPMDHDHEAESVHEHQHHHKHHHHHHDKDPHQDPDHSPNSHDPKASLDKGHEDPHKKSITQSKTHVGKTLDRKATSNVKVDKKLSKSERKLARKISKIMNIVSEQLGVKKTSKPTHWVVVWGAGLGLAIPKVTLITFLDPRPAEVRYYPDKPFATLRYDAVNDAEITLDMYNGVEITPGQMIYLSYINKEPPKEDHNIVAPFDRPWPPGLQIIPDFINAEEEDPIIQKLIPELAASGRDESGALKNRTVKHYGYEFRYETNDVDVENPIPDGIPDYIVPYVGRMLVENYVPRIPEQLTVNQYHPGQGIPPHVDTHSCFQETIVSLSLGSHTVMDFRSGDEWVSVLLPRRSLLIMNGEARYLWTHGITGRTYDTVLDENKLGLTCEVRHNRISLTFRLVNPSLKCYCKFPSMCDYQQNLVAEKISEDSIAEEVETDLVHRIYDQIATHFSETRHTPWPKVKDFLSRLSPGQAVLDVGCGNGKYFNINEYIYEVGIDMSLPLLEIAKQKKKKADGVRANCLKLPFRDNSFDAVISIAVLHHLSTKERRLGAVSEIFRVLKDGGSALIYVWAKDQKVGQIRSNYARQQKMRAGRDPDGGDCEPRPELKKYDFLPVHQHEENFRFSDMLVPWLSAGKDGKEPKQYHRYYHVFEQGEIESLLHELSPGIRIEDSYYDNGNWCVKMTKLTTDEILANFACEQDPYDAILGLPDSCLDHVYPPDFYADAQEAQEE